MRDGKTLLIGFIFDMLLSVGFAWGVYLESDLEFLSGVIFFLSIALCIQARSQQVTRKLNQVTNQLDQKTHALLKSYAMPPYKCVDCGRPSFTAQAGKCGKKEYECNLIWVAPDKRAL